MEIMLTQIPHALFRNVVIPTFMTFYLVDEHTDLDLDQLFKWATFLTAFSVPVFLVCYLCGYNLFTLIVYPSWTSWISPIQYLVYISLVNRLLHDNTDDSSFSFCLSVISASVAGYLYEVPRWIIRDGVLGLFRTAKMSFLVLDFGMLAVPFMFYMLRDRRILVNKLLVVSGLVYLFYVVFYTPLMVFYIGEVYKFVWVPLTVLCRVPAMVFIYQLVTSMENVK